jgi:hypothetical protein
MLQGALLSKLDLLQLNEAGAVQSRNLAAFGIFALLWGLCSAL